MTTITVPTSRPAAPSTQALRREREIARLLAGPLDRLNFGCGDHPLPGWTNIDGGDGSWYAAPGHPDVIALDLFDTLGALPDACASFITSEHLFEHFTLQDGHAILREWARVLRPGGVLRIVTPDLEAESRLYLRQIAPAPDDVIDRHRLRWLHGRCELQPGEALTRAIVLNHAMWLDGHRFIYDFETLAQSLRLAGFDAVVREAFGTSRHAPLAGIDRHDGGPTGRTWVPAVALVVEAARPASPAVVQAPPRTRGHTPGPAARAPVAPAPDHAAARADELAARSEALKRRLIQSVAARCDAAGWRRIALYGAGRHTAPIVRQPWRWHDVSVACVLDDAPKATHLGGVPILRPADAPTDLDAVVVSSDAHEDAIYARARAVFGPRGVPVLRIYGADALAREEPAASVARLVTRWGLNEADARWLVENRDERHDATLPMLPPERTEMHLRRYELADRFAASARVLDLACGTGYGSRFLLDQGGAASVLGLDIDERAVDYARRRFATPATAGRLAYRTGSATHTGLPDASVGLVASFETIEHVPDAAAALAEFHRVLAPGGVLVLSTPNDAGPTPHHAHSFTPETLRTLVEARFGPAEWIGQRAGDSPLTDSLPPGMFPLTPDAPRPDILIAIARR
jgi:ubiquinone/menaquinone biosynthesis C-methylase UbiE